MTSRRTRIKGIANIPQRKKTCAPSTENETEEKLKEETTAKTTDEIVAETNSNSVKEQNNIAPEKKEDNVVKETTLIKPRYRFLKPKPSISNACRNLKDFKTDDKPVAKKDDVSSDPENKPNSNAESSNKRSPGLAQNDSTFLVPKSTKFETEITLNETALLPSNQSNNSHTILERGIKRLIPTNVNNTQELEYPPPPHSPSKINRSRIKATPRLGQRRTSFSASESEDESRKYSRNRNDSVCSTASGIQEIVPLESVSQTKEFNSVIQRKCRRSEVSRKLAEARREFQIKFGCDKPNRSKLTMIDLIFYNPTTNPMPHLKQGKDSTGEPVKSCQDDESAENVDDPSDNPEIKSNESDEENDNPAPQIKIGPQGELIVDEKSLVIESKKTKQNRQELQKSSLVNGDFETGYGVYKRCKRSKDWDKQETLRFYKALNTIGTDFTLMCELFPDRERRELKQKFKKEERINRALIDRAITQPCSFDFEELVNEVALEEKELKEREKFNEMRRQEIKRRQMEHAKLTKKKKIEAELEKPSFVENELKSKPRKPKVKRMKSLSINSVLESDADESNIEESESEGEQSDVEIVTESKPTRSGRVPKTIQKFEPTLTSSFNRKRKISEEVIEAESNDSPEKYEPGSLMICCKDGPEGEPQYQFYMVTSNQNKTPIELNSNVMSSLNKMTELRGLNMQNLFTLTARPNEGNESVSDPEQIEENNVTIPAEENLGNNVTNPEKIGAIRSDLGCREIGEVKVENSQENGTLNENKNMIDFPMDS